MPTSDAAHRRSEHFTTRPRVGSPQGWWDTAGRLCSPELSVASGNVLTMKRAYTALCNATDRDQDLITALRWALDHAEDGQPVTLWCWDKEGLPAGPRGSGPSLGIAVHSEHPRPRGGRPFRAPNGPVVAVDLPLETLVEIEPFDDPVCLLHAYMPENDERGGWIGGDNLPFDRSRDQRLPTRVPVRSAHPDSQAPHHQPRDGRSDDVVHREELRRHHDARLRRR